VTPQPVHKARSGRDHRDLAPSPRRTVASHGEQQVTKTRGRSSVRCRRRPALP